MSSNSNRGSFVNDAGVRSGVLQQIVGSCVECQTPSLHSGIALIRLSSMIEVLANNLGNKEWIARVDAIKDECPINFERLAQFYAASWNKGARARVRFQDLGSVPYTRIRELAREHAVKPLVALAIEVVGEVAKDKTFFIREYLQKQSAVGEARRQVEFNLEV